MNHKSDPDVMALREAQRNLAAEVVTLREVVRGAIPKERAAFEFVNAARVEMAQNIAALVREVEEAREALGRANDLILAKVVQFDELQEVNESLGVELLDLRERVKLQAAELEELRALVPPPTEIPTEPPPAEETKGHDDPTPVA
jgi:hypothetical protein